jgi:predicted RNA-binding Zn ribbon-like protein
MDAMTGQLVKMLLMETAAAPTASPRELPIVAGHLALDFANTVDDPLGPARHDHLSSYDDLVRWGVRSGCLDDAAAAGLRRTAGQHPRKASATLARAHELRDVLNDVFGAALDGAGDLSAEWARLHAFDREARAAAELRRAEGGHYEWAWSQTDDLALVLHPVTSAATELLVSEDLRKLKRCGRCPWFFLDVSKNHSRRWCDMNDCGRAQKIERYVARRAARRRGEV